MEHTTIRNEKLFCLNCGGEFKLTYPITIDEMTKKINAFNLLHQDCKKTWVEPKVNQNESIKEKASWWLLNGETGLSSRTMWNCFMENHNDFPIHHPHDPDDFKRCYKLLQAVPEWKSELYKLKPLSIEWTHIVDNWDKLTEMYEKKVKAKNWEDLKKIGMDEFMRTLIS